MVEDTPTTLHAAVVVDPIDVDALIERVQHDGTGAISIFLGTVRDVNDGRPVSGMDYEAYGSMAKAEMLRIAEECQSAEPSIRIAVEHRVGTLAIRDVSVAIVCGHAHRAPAIAACARVIEELKRRVPVWKREHYTDGERIWLDPAATQVGAQ